MEKNFKPERSGLEMAIELLLAGANEQPDLTTLPDFLPDQGVDEAATMALLKPLVLDGARDFSAPDAFAHMDPPTPWISWVMAMWIASKNQNLLHAETSPVASEIEELVVRWLAPFFGMDGGHMVPGSTLANLTALWAAREQQQITQIICSREAHISIRKAANILGLDLVELGTNENGIMQYESINNDVSKSALVLTAGTTMLGAVDCMPPESFSPAWVHMDAAWAGPLRLTKKYDHLLSHCQYVDSIALSAHKWLFQPKESAFVFFKNSQCAHAAIRFGADYLLNPNVGLLGSHGAVAIPLMASLLTLGRAGLARLIEHSMTVSHVLAKEIEGHRDLVLYAPPQTGVLVWRPKNRSKFAEVESQLPLGFASSVTLGDEPWLRNVAANPMVNSDHILKILRDLKCN